MTCIVCQRSISPFASRCAPCAQAESRRSARASADSIYERLVAQHDLYGQAFFGWAATPDQRRTLRTLWRQARRRAMA